MSTDRARGWPAASAAAAARRPSEGEGAGEEARRAVPPTIEELIRAGVGAVRAHPALVGVRWGIEMAVTVLVVAGTVLPAAALFGPRFGERFAPLAAGFYARDAEALAVAVLDLAVAVAAAPGRFAAGLAGLAGLWTLAMFAYCWLQGGFYAVLVAADRTGEPVFSARRFAVSGRRLIWRYFWFVNLYATLLLGVVLVLLLPPALLPAPAPGELPVAALASLLLLMPFAAVAVAALALWYALGRVELAREGSGVRAASRRAWTALRRRPGPVLGVSLLAAGALLAVSGLATPVSVALPAAVLPLTVAQWLAGAAVATFHAGALVRLVRTEMPGAAAAAVEDAA